MNFEIESQLFKDFSGLTVGVVVVNGANNVGEMPEINTLLRTVEQEVKSKYSGMAIPEHPYIKPWRDAYRKFGSKPNDFRCSSETLLRMVLNGKELRHINKLVDLYNYISLKYTLTLGGEDLDKMQGDLLLTYADGTEPFIPLGTTENDFPGKGEVVYKDDLGIICRRWNWREGDRTKLTEESNNVVLAAEALPPIEREILESATKELAGLVGQFCGGIIHMNFVNSTNSNLIL